MRSFLFLLTLASQFLVHKQPEFEVHAQSQADLARGVAAMTHARAAFSRYFAAPAPPVALVLYEDEHQGAGVSVPGYVVLRWPASTEGPARTGSIGTLCVAIADAVNAGGVMIYGIFEGGVCGGAPLQRGDVITHVNGTRVTAMDDFGPAWSRVKPGDEVTFRVTRGGASSEVRFAKPAASGRPPEEIARLTRGAVAAAGKTPTPAATLSHEAMHALAGARFGAAALPAWLSEGLATLAEYPEDLAAVRRRMRASIAKRLEWTRLFTMAHPASSGTVLTPNAAAGMPVRIAGDGALGQLFYDQSATLLMFLAEQGGDRLVGRVVEAVAKGARAEDALRAAGASIQSIDQLEAGWRAWLSGKELE